ncbi:uncharacterized protein LOC106804385 [Setaria italica]|uniref:uncharacterized protein LOC106804385 n=1 Tax=Setaria italica TaxID=4555 RepID=UPI0007199D17|nr:uncharacterized protein LOC106804385 [Setaria italica]
MTSNRSTSFTPFFMVYDAKAILPTNLIYGAPRVRVYDEERLEEARQDVLDQLDKACDVTLLRSAKYQQALRCYHNKSVRGWAFQVGDLVLRMVQTTKGRHKLTPPWEGPYTIVEVLHPGAYRLKDEDGDVLTNS